MISIKPRAGGLCKIGFHSWKLQVNKLGEFPLYRSGCRRTACDIFSGPLSEQCTAEGSILEVAI
jgi:hypothetical protein